MTNTTLRTAVLTTAVLFCGLIVLPLPAEDSPAGNVELGKRIYEQGIGHDGRRSRRWGRVISRSPAVILPAPDVIAAAVLVPVKVAITFHPSPPPICLKPRRVQRSDRYRALFIDPQSARQSAYVRSPRIRPAYNMETLHTALATGVDPGDNRFQDLMPRYQLDQRDMANLYAYLQTCLLKYPRVWMTRTFIMQW